MLQALCGSTGRLGLLVGGPPELAMSEKATVKQRPSALQAWGAFTAVRLWRCIEPGATRRRKCWLVAVLLIRPSVFIARGNRKELRRQISPLT